MSADSGYSSKQLLADAEREAKALVATQRDRAALQPSALEFVRREIVKAARGWPADLVVMGSHGRGFVPRVLLGSVAEAVLCHCPLLIVRATE